MSDDLTGSTGRAMFARLMAEIRYLRKRTDDLDAALGVTMGRVRRLDEELQRRRRDDDDRERLGKRPVDRSTWRFRREG